MDFQLNPELNLEQITKDFSADHRVQINDLLPVEQAAHLSQCLAEKITYKQAFVVDGNFGEASLEQLNDLKVCLLYTSPSPRDRTRSRMPSSA